MKKEKENIAVNRDRMELSLKEIQETELELLLAFDRVCSEQGLRYSLGGGTLLGAVRHKGFIPWDDDIDVMMPRPDYEAFLNCCKVVPADFDLASHDTEEGYYNLFAKLSDRNTIIIDELSQTADETGISIDVFPIDGLGETEEQAKKIFHKTDFHRELLNAAAWKRYFRSKTHSIVVEPIRLAMYVLSRFTNPKKLIEKIEKENKKHPFEGSVYAGCVCGSYREKEIMRTWTFENYCDMEFEGHQLKAIQNYDEYLKKHYGDYMKLPPEEKQKTHHTYKAYRK